MEEPEGSPPQQEVKWSMAGRPSLERTGLKTSSELSLTLDVPKELSVNNRMKFMCRKQNKKNPTQANDVHRMNAGFLKVNLSKGKAGTCPFH